MNLAIEYMLRSGLSQKMLKMPCSLLLNNVFDKNNKLVVTIQSCYGKPDELTVKHWFISRLDKKTVLPPCEEFSVLRKDLYTSPITIVENFKSIEYQAEPYRIHPKQSADEPYATLQERQFHECMDTFFNCHRNDYIRINWLWNCFVNYCFPESTKSEFGTMSEESQRNMVQDICPIPWKAWLMWTKHLLITLPNNPVASELAFGQAYQDKLLDNKPYQENLAATKKPRQRNYKYGTPFVSVTYSNTPGSWYLDTD